MLYLCALNFSSHQHALLVAATAGIATCLWSVSSQLLLQSSPALFFLTLASYCFFRIDRGWPWAAGCGAALGWSVVCRPTCAVFVVAMGAYLLLLGAARLKPTSSPAERRQVLQSMLAFALGGLPFALLLGSLNWADLGSPWLFGQTVIGDDKAVRLGMAHAWDGPFLEGFLGLLLSPSRGLLVYTPLFIFSILGLRAVWTQPHFEKLRPLSLAAVALILIQSKWYSWAGGWSFGYRLLVEIIPVLALCAVPVVPAVLRSWKASALAGLLLCFSVAVQFVGAWAFNGQDWNGRHFYLVSIDGMEVPLLLDRQEDIRQFAAGRSGHAQLVRLTIDEFPDRLWSISDSQLVYYATHFGEAVKSKKEIMAAECSSPFQPTSGVAIDFPPAPNDDSIRNE